MRAGTGGDQPRGHRHQPGWPARVRGVIRQPWHRRVQACAADRLPRAAAAGGAAASGTRAAGSAGHGRAIGGPVSIAISPDGTNVYVASAGSDAVSVFARNRRTGVISQLAGERGCVSQRPGGGCVVGRVLNEPTSVAVSPDGAHVYVDGPALPEWRCGVQPRGRRQPGAAGGHGRVRHSPGRLRLRGGARARVAGRGRR